MKLPVSWIREYANLGETTADDLGAALVTAGLELEALERGAAGISGPIVVGRVLSFDEEPQKNGKIIRWCRVDCGPEHNDAEGGRGIICGAHNFAPGDLVAAALPGAVLPGNFEIASRKTYGHISDGMLCAIDELGLGTSHDGIIILPTHVNGREVQPGDDALDVMGAREEVLDLGVTPDMGYALSVRGVAREAAQALGVGFTDPIPPRPVPESADGHPVRVETEACPHFVALTVDGIDPSAPSPEWMQTRLRQAGMRSISLTVDVTNYVMLETGQPLHAYDADRLQGAIVVRRAQEGETLTTLDDAERTLDPEDVVIADDSGPIGLAGVMGGASTEVTDATTRVVVEAAHFDRVAVTRASRRHQLSTEASRRFERGVDPAAAYPAAERVASLLADLGGGRRLPEQTVVGTVAERTPITMKAGFPAEVLGRELSIQEVLCALEGGGSRVTAMGESLTVIPPTWRPDLAEQIDLVEEVGRKTGLDAIAPRRPRTVGGRGLTPSQRQRRSLAQVLATRGLVEVAPLPFMSDDQLDKMGVDAADARRQVVRIANPLSEEFPALRSTLLPGLFAVAARNASRSQDDVALFEIGRIFHQQGQSAQTAAPVPALGQRPSDEELAQFRQSLPAQPRHVGALVAGQWRQKDWRGPSVSGSWEQIFALIDAIAGVYGATPTRRAAEMAPFHPGRCAEIRVDGEFVGYAGELHPSVCQAFSLPPRSAALEMHLDALEAVAKGPGQIGALSPFPVVKEDVALIVDAQTPVDAVADALRAGAGDLLESVSLFDIYEGPQVGEGRKSLAFSLRFRAPDRTLTQDEVTQARTAAVSLCTETLGAEQRLA